MRTANRKERPQCRQAIHNLKLRPYLEHGVWDGNTYWQGSDPQLHSAMSDGLRVQMRKMAQEGVWGPVRILRNIWFDGRRYIPIA